MSAADMLAAIGDPMRREIFERLTAGPIAVGELARTLPISRPAVSQHLAVLKKTGLVFERQQATRRLYQVDPEGFAELRAYLDVFWDRSLASFRNAFPDTETRGDDTDDDA
ncbi:ArsR/SmtB family transcription factor [Nocardia donostiensis]|uniref:Transcriptional regulator n=1 Tax=Nocardia donostiensis TaxID=1538463 RepID=A0A1W0BA55_9NOCA|nr:metalloregulator ArsR/SmtB family transcription factor [Nocardia donostiensis]ONM50047.1 transcriptional regulator [Nocardia donostiensis]OQS19413.1 transcriptional regulator [Nocardia donostiensis]